MATISIPSFSDFWNKLMSNKLALAVIATLITSATHLKISMSQNANGQTQVTIILPDGTVDTVDPSNPNAFLSKSGASGAIGGADGIRLQFLRFKVRVAVQMSQEQKIPFLQAFGMCNKVTQAHFAEMAIKAGCPPEAIGDGTFLKNIFAWISDPANQEKVKQLIKFFMELALAFKTAGIDSTLFHNMLMDSVYRC